jgi:hypothetical protein
MSEKEFSLYWWDAHDGQHEELRFVDAETAVKRSFSLANGPAAKLGMVKKIMITDGGDCCVFEWNNELGVVWPAEEENDFEEWTNSL